MDIICISEMVSAGDGVRGHIHEDFICDHRIEFWWC